MGEASNWRFNDVPVITNIIYIYVYIYVCVCMCVWKLGRMTTVEVADKLILILRH